MKNKPESDSDLILNLDGREILALAADYNPTEPETQVFFQMSDRGRDRSAAHAHVARAR